MQISLIILILQCLLLTNYLCVRGVPCDQHNHPADDVRQINDGLDDAGAHTRQKRLAITTAGLIAFGGLLSAGFSGVIAGASVYTASQMNTAGYTKFEITNYSKFTLTNPRIANGPSSSSSLAVPSFILPANKETGLIGLDSSVVFDLRDPSVYGVAHIVMAWHKYYAELKFMAGVFHGRIASYRYGHWESLLRPHICGFIQPKCAREVSTSSHHPTVVYCGLRVCVHMTGVATDRGNWFGTVSIRADVIPRHYGDVAAALKPQMREYYGA